MTMVVEDIEKLGEEKVPEERRGSDASSIVDPEAVPQLPPQGPPLQDRPDSAGREASEVEPPPNGGSLAWLQVLGSFFLFWNSW